MQQTLFVWSAVRTSHPSPAAAGHMKGVLFMEYHPIANIFPLMEETEFEYLVEDIRRNGLHEPIYTYEGKILDGRNRELACQKLGITPEYIAYTGDDPLSYAISMNVARRHLTPSQRACLAVDLLPVYEVEANKRMLAGVAPYPGELIPQGRSKDFAAEKMQVNSHYVTDAKIVREEAPELFEEMRAGIIHMKDAMREVKSKRLNNKHAELIKLAETAALSDRWNVFVGDIGNVELEPNSLDAIITDPPYPQDCLPLWRELGKFAKRHLKVGGVMLAMTGSLYLPQIINMLNDNLIYQWVLACVLPGQHSEVHAAWVNNQMWKMVLVYRNGGDLVNIGSDLFENDKRDKDYHEWGQGVGGYIWQVEHLTKPNDLICDPFLGGGTTGIAALVSSRRFVGFDIDEEKVAIAKARIMQCETK